MKNTRKNRKIKSKKGGRIIGEGMQGIAFSPPLYCESGTPNVVLNSGRASPFTKTLKTYVTKITNMNTAKTELSASEELRRLVDPYTRFTAPALAICKASNTQTNENYSARTNNIRSRKLNTLVFSRYRGESIFKIFERADTLEFEEVENILVALCNLLDEISIHVNAAAGILHYDAHPGNIVYDSDTKIASLIDFGFARKLDDETSSRLKAGDFSVKATLDVHKVFNDSILQFFLFGNEPPTLFLMTNPRLKLWFNKAKMLRKNEETSQEEYMLMARKLTKAIISSNVESATSSNTE